MKDKWYDEYKKDEYNFLNTEEAYMAACKKRQEEIAFQIEINKNNQAIHVMEIQELREENERLRHRSLTEAQAEMKMIYKEEITALKALLKEAIPWVEQYVCFEDPRNEVKTWLEKSKELE